METKEIINLLTASDEGKTIQIKNKVGVIQPDGTFDIAYVCERNDSDGWYDVPDGALMQCIAAGEMLRVKPESKYRPYKDADEFIKACIEHGEWLRVKNPVSSPNALRYIRPTIVTDKFVKYGAETEFYRKILDNFVWHKDGTPCGVVEDAK